MINKLSCYPMTSSPCGRCLIFNNDFNHTGEPRKGTEIDEKNAELLFKWLNFKVIKYNNLTAEETINSLKLQAMDTDLKKEDVFVCFFLSHGFEQGVYGNSYEEIKFSQIFEVFDGIHCKALINKPKLFFTQACGGTNHIYPQMSTDHRPTKYAPPKSDILLFHATTPKNVAYIDKKKGSWFVGDICSVFQDNAGNLGLLVLIMKVNSKMSMHVGTNDKNERITAQSSARENTLRRELYFEPLGEYEAFKKENVWNKEKYEIESQQDTREEAVESSTMNRYNELLDNNDSNGNRRIFRKLDKKKRKLDPKQRSNGSRRI